MVAMTKPEAGGVPRAFPGNPPVKPEGKCGYQMQQMIETHLPHLTQAQLAGLGPGGSVGLFWLAAPARTPWPLPSRPGAAWNNLRQYLREWLYDGSDRARPCKTELDVNLCFAPLLKWVLAWWRSGWLAPVSSTGQALAVDPTLKGDETTAIVISVVYRGCAIPVAWRICRATQLGSWMDPIVELLQDLAPAVAQGNDRDRAVRPGPGQSQIVEADTRSEPAPGHDRGAGIPT